MLKIRLTRTGKKHAPHYRIIVIKARTKRDGKAIEYLGHHDPRKKETKLNVERAKYWLSVGAQPTDTVYSILVKHNLAKQKPRPERPPLKSKKEKKESKEAKPKKKSPPKADQPATKKDEKKTEVKEKVVKKEEKKPEAKKAKKPEKKKESKAKDKKEEKK